MSPLKLVPKVYIKPDPGDPALQIYGPGNSYWEAAQIGKHHPPPRSKLIVLDKPPPKPKLSKSVVPKPMALLNSIPLLGPLPPKPVGMPTLALTGPIRTLEEESEALALALQERGDIDENWGENIQEDEEFLRMLEESKNPPPLTSPPPPKPVGAPSVFTLKNKPLAIENVGLPPLAIMPPPPKPAGAPESSIFKEKKTTSKKAKSRSTRVPIKLKGRRASHPLQDEKGFYDFNKIRKFMRKSQRPLAINNNSMTVEEIFDKPAPIPMLEIEDSPKFPALMPPPAMNTLPESWSVVPFQPPTANAFQPTPVGAPPPVINWVLNVNPAQLADITQTVKKEVKKAKKKMIEKIKKKESGYFPSTPFNFKPPAPSPVGAPPLLAIMPPPPVEKPSTDVPLSERLENPYSAPPPKKIALTQAETIAKITQEIPQIDTAQNKQKIMDLILKGKRRDIKMAKKYRREEQEKENLALFSSDEEEVEDEPFKSTKLNILPDATDVMTEGKNLKRKIDEETEEMKVKKSFDLENLKLFQTLKPQLNESSIIRLERLEQKYPDEKEEKPSVIPSIPEIIDKILGSTEDNPIVLSATESEEEPISSDSELELKPKRKREQDLIPGMGYVNSELEDLPVITKRARSRSTPAKKKAYKSNVIDLLPRAVRRGRGQGISPPLPTPKRTIGKGKKQKKNKK